MPIRCFILILCCCLMGCTQQTSERKWVRVFAASSLMEVIHSIADEYTAETGIEIQINTASSSTLARQIEQGADVDIYLSANKEWVNYLEERDLLNRSSIQTILSNRLVLVAHKDVQIDSTQTLSQMLSEYKERIAIANPLHVPAGQYAKLALQQMGLWEPIEDQIITGNSVRSTLRFVSMGEIQMGIVYYTDAISDENVVIIKEFSPMQTSDISYASALSGHARPESKDFYSYLFKSQANQIFTAAGFTPRPYTYALE